MNFVRTITVALTMIMAGAACPQWNAEFPEPDQSEVAAAFIDINHASAAELRTLPGIGEAYSLAIVKHRPYRNKTQLRSKGVIPLAAYKKIKDQIIAKQ